MSAEVCPVLLRYRLMHPGGRCDVCEQHQGPNGHMVLHASRVLPIVYKHETVLLSRTGKIDTLQHRTAHACLLSRFLPVLCGSFHHAERNHHHPRQLCQPRHLRVHHHDGRADLLALRLVRDRGRLRLHLRIRRHVCKWHAQGKLQRPGDSAHPDCDVGQHAHPLHVRFCRRGGGGLHDVARCDAEHACADFIWYSAVEFPRLCEHDCVQMHVET